MAINVYSGNLGWAALDPEPINRLPEKSGDGRGYERDKACPNQEIRPVSPEQPHNRRLQDYAKLIMSEQRKRGILKCK